MHPILKLTVIAVLALITISCHTQSKYSHQYFYNGRRHHSLIIHRTADFGDGHRDGCFSSNGLILKITDTHSQQAAGIVKETNKSPLSFAQINLTRKNGQEEKIQADSAGHFIIPKTNIPVTEIIISTPGYRPLHILARRKPLIR